MSRLRQGGVLASLALLAAACGDGSQHAAHESAIPAEVLAEASAAIDAEGLLRHIQVLASDEFEGRAPGGVGEERTIQYLTEQFRALGLQPGNPDGTYVQAMSLVGYRVDPSAEVRLGGRTFPLRAPQDFVAVSRRLQPTTEVRGSELVFVGYGVVAPEYDWDDYKDVDVTGKTIVMLINDPPVPDPNDPTKLDPNVFRGDAMTYYGRWTYKYEIAVQKGAAAAIIIHETGPAGYPYEVIAGSRSAENFDIRPAGDGSDRLQVEAWIPEPKARELLAAAGYDFDELKAAAVRRDFRPVSLGGTVDFRLRTTMREVQSHNVIAKLEGSDPEVRDEYVIYTAHWDHFGKDESLQGDQIYNGALDNASGTAGLLEVAEAVDRESVV